MLRSLRFRLLVMVAAVLLIALGSVAMLSTRVVSSEVRELLAARREMPPGSEEVALAVIEHRLRKGDWSGASRILAAAGRRTGQDLLVVDTGGRLVAASSPLKTYERVHVAEGGNRLSVVQDTGRGRGNLEFANPHRVVLTDPRGERLGMLFVTPSLPAGRLGPVEVASLGRIQRALLLAALIAGSAGLLLSIAVARRILKPVEALTAAARGMEAGDLSRRVPVRGKDEIAGLARAFNAMADRRATAERLRRDLVNDVAHELRSPLTN
ncbi:MAG TPA: HAMP domain-containing protein, partial [Thermoanaerobaculia bacterium]|nr:HAMP domain-containing protein [Thermoanaerobaculia bacterium]